MSIPRSLARGAIRTLFVVAGCRGVEGGDARTEGRTPSPRTDLSTGMVPSIKDTTMPSHPRAGAPPTLIVGDASIVLDSTTLADVGAAFGGESVVGDTTGHYRLLKACYATPPADDQVTVRLSALGYVEDSATRKQAMGTITVHQASIAHEDAGARASSATKRERCLPLAVPPAQIHWSHGLRLGLTRTEVERVLGAPRRSKAGDWVYEYDEPDFRLVRVDRASGKQVERRVAVTVGVQVRYEQDVATRIEAWYSWEPN